MNDDCISKNEVIGTIEAFFCCRCPDFLRCDYKCEIADLIQEFEKMRGVSIRESTHAHWVNHSVSITGAGSAECSNCGAVVHDSFCSMINYCPACGADMRGGSEK